jgi:D-sedoheptulose 7-phosphate isomerase
MSGEQLDVRPYLKRLQTELSSINDTDLRMFSDLVHRAWQHDRTIFILGNADSAAIASHVAQDLGNIEFAEQGLEKQPRGMRTVCLTEDGSDSRPFGDSPMGGATLIENLKVQCKADDLLIAISQSGNSPNVINAVDWANLNGLTTLGLTGYDGGELKDVAHHNLNVHLDDPGMIESIHLCAFHWVLSDVFARINGGVAATRRTGHMVPAPHGKPVWAHLGPVC